MQTSVFQKRYIVVFGGKNEMDTDLEIHCLHDLCFLDLDTLKWQPIVIYGFTPSGRWGQAMGVRENQLIIFGGVGESRLCSASVHFLEFEDKYIRENLAEIKKTKIILESEEKNAGLLQ
eukprot:TRINITY_DN7516_c0_g1_i1.p3 TRINITY_DN7516_c0_g1~~TRINITY_DN7516_c0_g1_i1.p3  ORF type:complete len:119 (+),score=9.71 TRINITY_DN7516_c0_g1_i1:3-359(+)